MMYNVLINTLERYLSQEISKEDLEEWLAEYLQGILDSGDARAIQVADQIQALMVEMTEGFVTEQQLRQVVYNVVCPEGDILQLTVSKGSNETRVESHKIVPTSPVVNLQYEPAAAGR